MNFNEIERKTREFEELAKPLMAWMEKNCDGIAIISTSDANLMASLYHVENLLNIKRRLGLKNYDSLFPDEKEIKECDCSVISAQRIDNNIQYSKGDRNFEIKVYFCKTCGKIKEIILL